MLEKVKETIENNHMLQKSDKILVALSGGCDSVCLTLILMQLGYNVGCAHLNHMLRDEADSDEAFVRAFANKYGLELFVKKADVGKTAREERISLESAGRNERYNFFHEICDKNGYTKIAVAHNKNDNCETFLLNLIRGTGLKGLCGIPPIRGKIVRPLIEASRNEIEAFVCENNEEYVTDKSNFANDYTRNKVRNIIIPHINEINANFSDNVYKTAELLRDDYEFITKCVPDIITFNKDKAMVDINSLVDLSDSVIARILQECYEYVARTSKDFEKKHIDYIIQKLRQGKTGNIIDLCFDTRCVIRYENLIFEKRQTEVSYSYLLDVNKRLYISEIGLTLTMKEVSCKEVSYNENRQYFSLPFGEVVVRNRREGDRIIPFGASFEKKLKKVYIDNKTDITLRDLLPVIEFNGDIIWAYGVCRSDLYRIESSNNKVYVIQGEYDK